MREEKQREHARNGDYEYVDNEIHFQPENEEELKEELIQYSLCFINHSLAAMSSNEEIRDVCVIEGVVMARQEPPPGTTLHDGAYCWKCKGTGEL